MKRTIIFLILLLLSLNLVLASTSIDEALTNQMYIYTGGTVRAIINSSGIYDGVGGNEYWHEGNDGTGSGLNADLLDGHHSTYFLTSATDNWVDESGDNMTGNLNMGTNDITDLTKISFIDSTRRVIIGSPGTSATGTYAMAIGYNASSSSQFGMAVGYKAEASTEVVATAIGYNSKSTGSNSLAIGSVSYSTGLRSLAIGTLSNATSQNSIAIGYNTDATATNAIALGTGTQNAVANSFKVGGSITQADLPATNLGGNLNLTGNDITDLDELKFNYNYISIGDNIDDLYTTESIAIGSNVYVRGTNGEIRINYPIAIGYSSLAKSYAIALGYKANATNIYSIAIGKDTDATANYAIALGAETQNAVANSFKVGGQITQADLPATNIQGDLYVNDTIKIEAGTTDHNITNSANNDLVIDAGTGGDIIMIIGLV